MFCRPVKFTDSDNDVSFLKRALVHAFEGLETRHIALLQIQSNEYPGHYVDILDANLEIADNSFVKVILRSEVSKLVFIETPHLLLFKWMN